MTHSSRKYVELIFKASSKWANWDPPYSVQCGHYGTINPDSGQLEINGNIYHESFKKHLPPDFDLALPEHQPMDGDVEDDLVITTAGVSNKGINVAPGAGLAGIANASLKVQLQFPQGKRAATLVMHKPRQTFIPPNTVLEPLFKLEALKDKYLVTKTFTCPAYSLYLSNKSGEQLSLALVVNSPLALAAPGVTAGGEVSVDWQTNIQTAFHRKASSKSGEYSFTPLFDLRRKVPRWKRLLRDSPTPSPEGDDLWTEAPLPWASLDEDGEELQHEEGVSGFDFEAYDVELDNAEDDIE
ncbi:hypothetical protein HYDPIDRAFT_27082 [Hydnomerulius pinastri MD-312]|nr:hypothetical protein HYDPIDRAFT_27082 [Hydnomerulius pinastri MD-312]